LRANGAKSCSDPTTRHSDIPTRQETQRARVVRLFRVANMSGKKHTQKWRH